MGLTKKSDGRYVVGKGIEDGNEYKGSAAWRDMVIQYSGDGATEKSLEYLTFLKDYALYHSAQGNPVIPPNVQIWMSTANTMKAVEADDITVDGETVKIGACTWDGSAWSFGEPIPGGGGSSLPEYTSADKGKVLSIGDASPVVTVVVPEQTLTVPAEAQIVPLANVEYGVDDFTVGITGIVTVNIGGESADIPVTFGTEQGVTGFLTSNPDLSLSVVYISGWQFAAGQPEEGYTCTVSLTASVIPSTTIVAVPEQTVTITEEIYDPDLSDVDASGFVEGATGTMRVNGVDYAVTAVNDPETGIGFFSEECPLVIIYDATNERSYVIELEGEGGTFTVSLSAIVHNVSPMWEEISALPDTDTARSGDVLMLDPYKNPYWGKLSSGTTVYAREWTYHNSSGSTSVTAGTITTLHNTSEMRGWGIPSVPGSTMKFYVDVSPLLAAGLIPTSSIVSDLNNLSNASIVDYVSLTDIEVYPLKTQTIPTSQYINIPVLVALV